MLGKEAGRFVISSGGFREECVRCCSLRRAWKSGGNVNLWWVTQRMRQTHHDLSTTLWGKGFLGWGVSKLWIFEDALLFAPFSQCRAPVLRPVLAEGQWSLPWCLVFSWAAEKVTPAGGSTGDLYMWRSMSRKGAFCSLFLWRLWHRERDVNVLTCHTFFHQLTCCVCSSVSDLSS